MPWDPKACSAAYRKAFLARRGAEGVAAGRSLFPDIRQRGYTGSFIDLARLLRARMMPIHEINLHPE
jgi:hypothetical protein